MSDPAYPITEWMSLLSYGDASADTNRNIVTDIISHPTELVTEVELVYMLTATDERTAEDVRAQLAELCDSGMVTRYDEDDYTFYGLTDDGKQFVVDSRQYRAHDVWKDIYRNVERTADVETAYEASRPDHAPSEREYIEGDYSESDVWETAREATFRTLTLSLERVGDTTFRARLVEGDEGRELATTDIEVESVEEITDDYREMDLSEPRGTIVTDDEYGIEVTPEHGTYNIQPAKSGEGWYQTIERSLYIFTADRAD